MNKLMIKTSHGEDFACIKLPRLFLKLILDEFRKPDYRYIFTYIQKNYKISQSQIYEALKKAMTVSHIGIYYVIDFDSNVQINDAVTVGQIIRFIDCGNRNVRGAQIFANTSNYIFNRIPDLSRLALLKGDSKIWR